MAFQKKTKRRLLYGLIGLVVIVVVVINISGSGDSSTEVQADLAYLDEISEIVTASGRIQPQTQVEITSEVSAQIRELYVKEGDEVKKGQKLILLDTIQLKTDVSQARFSLDEVSARVQAAKTSLDQNKIEFDRQQNLFDKKLTSENDFLNARFAYESSQANYDAMLAQEKTYRARLDKMQDNLNKTLIKAPMAGVVTYLNAEVGEIAQAQTAYTQGKTLMTISDMSVFEVEIDVDETEISKVRLGQAGDIRVDAFVDTSFAGTVTEIGNSAKVSGQGTENYTTSFMVKVRFDDYNPLIRPGMSATVDITTAIEPNALLIPYASVVTREFNSDSLANKDKNNDSGSIVAEVNADELSDKDTTANTQPNDTTTAKKKAEKIRKTGVFCISDGKAVFKEVTTGIADDRHIEVLEGLTPGDTIVSGSFQTLRNLSEGTEVNIDERSKTRIEEQAS